MEARPELIAIVGPTASGKTALALDIAERHNGEIICADSRTIYAGMDIGTAKPTAEEQARVRHWGIDVVEPGDAFSAARFKDYAQAAINDIQARGKLPLLVGGTGLYIDSVLYDYQFGPKADEARRAVLDAMTIDELHKYCTTYNVTLPENHLNKWHLIRAIEVHGISDISKSALKPNNYIVGIATNKDMLRTRIIRRTEHMFEQDVEAEATILGKKYGWNTQAMTGNIYPLIKEYQEGLLNKQDVAIKNTTADYRLAKRQMTWFRRNPDIMWGSITGAKRYIESLLPD